ncbi:four helix bundle protein [Thermodesulfobacteriota bacterium]
MAYCSFCELEPQLLLSGELNYVNKENLNALKDDTEEVEGMLKALIKLLEYKHLNPCPLESSNPLLQLNWKRTIYK